MEKISAETVRADFNDPVAVVHYARAAHFLGLWKSERTLIERFFPDREANLLEAGCGAGRATIGLWDLGFTHITAFDFAEELLDQARTLAAERGAGRIQFLHADATCLSESKELNAIIAAKNTARNALAPPHSLSRSKKSKAAPPASPFDGVLFLFNGLMQIPGRENRRAALSELARLSQHGAHFLFTTHDRNSSPTERVLWRLEEARWSKNEQDPKLVEFGDRYFEDASGRTFMHLPDRAEILEDLAATGWTHEFDALRREIAKESRAVIDFSDECRFWVARKT